MAHPNTDPDLDALVAFAVARIKTAAPAAETTEQLDESIRSWIRTAPIGDRPILLQAPSAVVARDILLERQMDWSDAYFERVRQAVVRVQSSWTGH